MKNLNKMLEFLTHLSGKDSDLEKSVYTSCLKSYKTAFNALCKESVKEAKLKNRILELKTLKSENVKNDENSSKNDENSLNLVQKMIKNKIGELKEMTEQEQETSKKVIEVQTSLFDNQSNDEEIKEEVKNENVENEKNENLPIFNENEPKIAKKAKKTKEFIIPTYEDLKQVLDEWHNDNLNPKRDERNIQDFLDYYNANDWRINGRKKMLDYRLSFKNWLKRGYNESFYNENKKELVTQENNQNSTNFSFLPKGVTPPPFGEPSSWRKNYNEFYYMPSVKEKEKAMLEYGLLTMDEADKFLRSVYAEALNDGEITIDNLRGNYVILEDNYAEGSIQRAYYRNLFKSKTSDEMEIIKSDFKEQLAIIENKQKTQEIEKKDSFLLENNENSNNSIEQEITAQIINEAEQGDDEMAYTKDDIKYRLKECIEEVKNTQPLKQDEIEIKEKTIDFEKEVKLNDYESEKIREQAMALSNTPEEIDEMEQKLREKTIKDKIEFLKKAYSQKQEQRKQELAVKQEKAILSFKGKIDELKQTSQNNESEKREPRLVSGYELVNEFLNEKFKNDPETQATLKMLEENRMAELARDGKTSEEYPF